MSQTNPTSCTVFLFNPDTQSTGKAESSITGTFSPPVPGSPSSFVGASFSADAYAYPSGADTIGPAGTGYATVSASTNLELYTIGPSRPGFIAFSEALGLGYGGDPPDTNLLTINIGSLTQSCIGPGTTSCSGFGPSDGTTLGNILLPFTVGTQFAFSFSLNLNATSNTYDEIETGIDSGEFDFEVLDSAGTPVQLYVAPEPGTFSILVCASFVGVLCLRRKQPS